MEQPHSGAEQELFFAYLFGKEWGSFWVSFCVCVFSIWQLGFPFRGMAFNRVIYSISSFIYLSILEK